MQTLKETLIRRDNLEEHEAEDLINEAQQDLRERLENGEIPDEADFMQDWFSLEPDYIIEIL